MKKILIVDDQKTILITLEAILKKEGYLVFPCTNSIDALDKVNSEHIDLMITDAVMPVGSNGFHLISTIRGIEKVHRIPIIMLTGKRERADVERALEAGANDYIVKPIDPDILISKVAGLLEKSTLTSDFVEAPLLANASIHTKTEIIAIAETGLTLTCNYQLSIGQVFRVSSDFFKQLGFDFVNTRVASCEQVNSATGTFKIHVHFIGLADKELSQIRLWIRSKLRA